MKIELAWHHCDTILKKYRTWEEARKHTEKKQPQKQRE